MTEKEKYLEWKKFVTDEELIADLESIDGNDAEISDRFYRGLSFGTAGLRGILGAGTNRMNIYTVRRATKGLADYLNAKKEGSSVAIAYDTRKNSERFAKESAALLAANGIKVWIYAEPAPTPMLSYAVRERNCDAGIVITASHNPANYNGYKAYGADGCQISPETAKEITEYIENAGYPADDELCDFDEAVAEKKIILLPESFWRRYYARVIKEGVDREHHYENELSIVYTPLNGTGKTPVLNTLSLAGFGNVTVVPEQSEPDSDFATCPFPNPEIPETLTLAIEKAKETGADIVIATDPDSDRIGVVSKETDGFRILTGNEVGVMLLNFIAEARKANGTMPEKPVAIRSFVSTRFTDAVAEYHGIELLKVFTGFRFIGKAIAELEEKGESENLIFSYEESCGYLSGTYVRDKDAVDASLMVCEMANWFKLRGKTLGMALDELRKKFGYYLDGTDNFYFPGAEGAEHIKGMMEKLRQNKPETVGGKKITETKDYLPESNMLEFVFESGEGFIVRPSGTEPKIKLYYFIKGEDKISAENTLETIKKDVRSLLGV